ncbi:MAG: sulfotransferase [Pseudomonadota bacterium]
MSTTVKKARLALERGDFDAAVQASELVLRSQPRDIDALTVFARAKLATSQPTEAAAALAEIIKSDPEMTWAFVALGEIYLQSGRTQQAEALLRRALLQQPEQPTAHAKMGVILSENNELSGGEFHLRRALALGEEIPDEEMPDKDKAHVFADLALNLTQQGRSEEAHALYAEANERLPNDVRIAAYWAKLFELDGNLEQAHALLNDIERSSASEVDLLRASLDARRGQTDRALETLETAGAIGGDALLERGRIYDRRKEYDRAWADFESANTWFRQQALEIRYDPEAVEAFFSRLSRFFTAPVIERLPVAAVRESTPQPIFIVGSPRSGTTLLERVLARHSAVVAGGELPFIADLREFSERLLPGGKFPDNLRLTNLGSQRHVASLFRDYYFAKAEERGLLQAADGYFTDKMPFNECYLPVIRMAFPEAAIVHLVRHPLDIVVSMFANKLNHGFYCAYSVADIVHHLLAVHKLHEHYRGQLATGETVVRYESLVSEPEAETRRLLAAVGLPFEQACLAPQDSGNYSPTPSYAAVGVAINTKAVNRFVNYSDKLEHYRDQLGPLLEAGGYDARP